MNKPILFLLFLAAVSLLPSYGQTPSSYDIAARSQNFYPSSVQASGLFRRQPDGGDYATGRVTVRIPLYTIRTASFSLPVSLVYTTGGVKADQKNGPVALGWSLEAEPVISREVRGLPDERSFLYDKSNLTSQSDLYLAKVGMGTCDLLEDFFHIRLPGGVQADFALEQASNYAFTPRMFHRDPLEVELDAPRVSANFRNGLTVTDGNGVRYLFGGSSASREETNLLNTYQTVTAWKATQMISPDGDTLSFDYVTNLPQEVYNGRYDYYAVEDNWPDYHTPGAGVPPHPGYWKGVGNQETYYWMNGTTRQADGTEVPNFEAWSGAGGRPYFGAVAQVDIRPVGTIRFAGGSVTFGYDATHHALSTVTVRNPDGVLRTVSLTKHLDSYGRLLLDKVEVKDASGDPVETYSFAYYSGGFSPDTKAVDYWGYYNGQTGNTGFVARQQAEIRNGSRTYTFEIGDADKRGNLSAATTYSLRQITWPGGGTTEYTYTMGRIPAPGEADGYMYGGGLLVKEITDRPVVGHAVRRLFLYYSGDEEEGIGCTRFPMSPLAYRQELQKHYVEGGGTTNPTVRSVDYTLYSHSNVVTADDRVYFDRVMEYVSPTLTFPSSSSSTVSGFYLGEATVHCYDNRSEFPSSYYTTPGMLESIDEPLNNASLLCSETRSELHEHAWKSGERTHARPFRFVTVNELKRTALVEGVDESMVQNSQRLRELYGSTFTRLSGKDYTVVDNDPTGRGETLYYGGGLSYTRSVSHTREGSYNRIRRTSVSTSSGVDELTEYTYPFDRQGPVDQLMTSAHDLSTPVEVKQYAGGELYRTVRYVYAADASTARGYSLRSVEESTDGSGGTFRTVESYSSYLPCGKPCQVTSADGTVTSLLWSHGGKHLLASARNLPLSVLTSAGLSPSELSESQSVPESVYTLLDGLRSSHPEAQLEYWRYDAHVGPTGHTAPDGTSTYYGYDSAGRLNVIKDNEQHTLSTYEYHESNPN